MITFTGGPVYLGDKRIFPDGTDLLIDCQARNGSDVVSTIYAQTDGEVVGKYETAYTIVDVDGQSVSETDITAMFREAVHLLEKQRLEDISENSGATFTITL